MQKPDFKKLKEKLLPKLPKIVWRKGAVKAGRALKSAGAKSIAAVKGGFAWLKKWRSEVFMVSGLLGFSYATMSGMTYLTNLDRNKPSVTFKDGEASIVVYPERQKLIREEGDKYFTADYLKKSSCEGIILNVPAWIAFYSENRKSYSMIICRAFGKATGADKRLDEKAVAHERYLLDARRMQGLDK